MTSFFASTILQHYTDYKAKKGVISMAPQDDTFFPFEKHTIFKIPSMEKDVTLMLNSYDKVTLGILKFVKPPCHGLRPTATP